MLASVFISKLEYLTEDVGKKVVLLKKGHVAIAFTTGISNQTPVNNKWRISSAKLHKHIFSLSTSSVQPHR